MGDGAGLCDDGVDERGGGAAEVPVAHVDDGAHAQAHARAVLEEEDRWREEERWRQSDEGRDERKEEG